MPAFSRFPVVSRQFEEAVSRFLALDRRASPPGPATRWIQRLREAAYPSFWDSVDILADLASGAPHLTAHPAQPRFVRLADALRIAFAQHLDADGPWQTHLQMLTAHTREQRAAEQARLLQQQFEEELERTLAQALSVTAATAPTETSSPPVPEPLHPEPSAAPVDQFVVAPIGAHVPTVETCLPAPSVSPTSPVPTRRRPPTWFFDLADELHAEGIALDDPHCWSQIATQLERRHIAGNRHHAVDQVRLAMKYRASERARRGATG